MDRAKRNLRQRRLIVKIGARHSARYIAAGVLGLVATWAAPLVGQGGRRATRKGAAIARQASTELRLASARSVLHTLVGTWHFEMRFAGNFDGPADVSGTRVVKPLFDDKRLEWTETLDQSHVQGQGVVGYDDQSERFFSSAVSSAGASPELMTGTLDDAEPLITFNPLSLVPDSGAARVSNQAFAVALLDNDHFTTAALDRAWRAVFTRQK
jgi:hypothetical protein